MPQAAIKENPIPVRSPGGSIPVQIGNDIANNFTAESKLAARNAYYPYLGPLCPKGIGMGVKIVYFVHPFHSFQAIGNS